VTVPHSAIRAVPSILRLASAPTAVARTPEATLYTSTEGCRTPQRTSRPKADGSPRSPRTAERPPKAPPPDVPPLTAYCALAHAQAAPSIRCDEPGQRACAAPGWP
jgi:hypothetical protein